MNNSEYKTKVDINTRLLDACMFVARIANIAAKYDFSFTEQEFINVLKAQKADIDAVKEEAIEDDLIAKTIYEIALEHSATKPTEREIIIWDNTTEALHQEIEKSVFKQITIAKC